MSKIKSSFVMAVLMCLTLLLGVCTAVRNNGENAEALSDDKQYLLNNGIYYFSDSTPAFEDAFALVDTSNVTVEGIVIDVQTMITPQKLEFLLRTGYFWGFEPSYRINVIIELKTMKPDSSLLEDLFACLKAQRCKVMFISPYATEYGYFKDCDVSMDCNPDLYSLFLKDSIMYMSDDGYFREKTTMLLDGRLIDMQSVSDVSDVLDLCLTSPTLRRLLLYMYYGCNDEESYELCVNDDVGVYEKIWNQFYPKYFMQIWGYDFGYYGDIDDYIALWTMLDRNYYGYIDNMWSAHGAEFESIYNSEIKAYYKELINALSENDIHMLVNDGGDIYYDFIFGDNATQVVSDSFADYTGMLDYFRVNNIIADNIFAMIINNLPLDFYTLLQDVQEVIEGDEHNSEYQDFPIFMWAKYPFVDDPNGLKVITEDALRDYYGITLYEQNELDSIFAMLLGGIISDV